MYYVLVCVYFFFYRASDRQLFFYGDSLVALKRPLP